MNFPAGITDTERALMGVAYVVMRHGDKYAWAMDRLEQQLEVETAGSATRQRASKILLGLTREVRNASAG